MYAVVRRQGRSVVEYEVHCAVDGDARGDGGGVIDFVPCLAACATPLGHFRGDDCRVRCIACFKPVCQCVVSLIGNRAAGGPVGRVATVACRAQRDGDVHHASVDADACPSDEGVARAGGVVEGECGGGQAVTCGVGWIDAATCEVVGDGVVGASPGGGVGAVARRAVGDGDGNLRGVAVAACPSGEDVAAPGRDNKGDIVAHGGIDGGVVARAATEVVGDCVVLCPCGGIGAVARRAAGDDDSHGGFSQAGSNPSGEGVAVAGGVGQGEGVGVEIVGGWVAASFAAGGEAPARQVVGYVVCGRLEERGGDGDIGSGHSERTFIVIHRDGVVGTVVIGDAGTIVALGGTDRDRDCFAGQRNDVRDGHAAVCDIVGDGDGVSRRASRYHLTAAIDYPAATQLGTQSLACVACRGSLRCAHKGFVVAVVHCDCPRIGNFTEGVFRVGIAVQAADVAGHQAVAYCQVAFILPTDEAADVMRATREGAIEEAVCHHCRAVVPPDEATHVALGHCHIAVVELEVVAQRRATVARKYAHTAAWGYNTHQAAKREEIYGQFGDANRACDVQVQECCAVHETEGGDGDSILCVFGLKIGISQCNIDSVSVAVESSAEGGVQPADHITYGDVCP